MMATNAPPGQANPRGTDEQTKVFNDPVHGHMEFDPVCVAIIDTPQFQRLRFLKQLGVSYYVYPGACHNRFEHSLGVCFLAGLMVKSLRERQPELGISDADVLCVKIAGLCHDLGHGPFSHIFDNKYMPKAKPGTTWKHEQASIDMFDYMVEKNSNVKTHLDKLGAGCRPLIKQLIEGKPPSQDGNEDRPQFSQGAWVYSSKDQKAFLYELSPSEDHPRFSHSPSPAHIVANKRNGVDVDKWDYFKRDSLHLGMSSGFDHMRLIKFARVIKCDRQWQICFRDKEAFNMYEMFHTRQVLHRRAYQHKTVQKIELMLVDAMLEYDEYLKQVDSTERPMCESTDPDKMGDFVKLTDAIFHDILQKDDDNPHLKKAQGILQNIHERKLYELVGESEPYTRDSASEVVKKTATDIEEGISKKLATYENPPDTQDFAVQFLQLDLGMKEKDPVEHVRFYFKTNPNETISFRASEVSFMLPQKTFQELRVRLFFRPSEDQKDKRRIQLLKDAFKEWCTENDLNPRTNTKLTVMAGGDMLAPYAPHGVTKTDDVIPDNYFVWRIRKDTGLCSISCSTDIKGIKMQSISNDCRGYE